MWSYGSGVRLPGHEVEIYAAFLARAPHPTLKAEPIQLDPHSSLSHTEGLLGASHRDRLEDKTFPEGASGIVGAASMMLDQSTRVSVP